MKRLLASGLVLVALLAISLVVWANQEGELFALEDGPARGGEVTATAAIAWQTECVDCPKLIESLTESSLQLDSAGWPHVAYGGDHLYYAWRDGSGWHHETVDNTPGVGADASLVLDAQDRPHISYSRGHFGEELGYAHWTDTSWSLESVPGANDAIETSIALDSSGYPHVAFTDEDIAVRHARWTGTSWDVSTVEAISEIDLAYPSLVLDDSDHAHISYTDSDNGRLRYARWSGSEWQIQTVDTGYVLGSSLVLDDSDHPRISYMAWYDLRYASWDGDEWDIFTLDDSDNVSWHTSLRLDSSDRPHIAYGNSGYGSLRYVRWDDTEWVLDTVTIPGGNRDNALALDSSDQARILSLQFYYSSPTAEDSITYAAWNGSSWSAEVVDTSSLAGFYNAIAIDTLGIPHIGYQREFGWGTRFVMHAARNGAAWNAQVVDSTAAADGRSSLALDNGGYPHISYPEEYAGELRYAHWDGFDWQITVVDSSGAGVQSSLALDAFQRPHIGFYRPATGAIDYAYWTGSEWEFQTIDTNEPWYGTNLSLAVDSGDHPHVAYQYYREFRYANRPSSTWMTETVDMDSIGGGPSLALDSLDLPHIIYRREGLGLRYARWTGTAWDMETVDTTPAAGYKIRLALDQQDSPHIAYLSAGALFYMFKNGGEWQTFTVQDGSAGSIGDFALALDGEGNPHLSYVNQSTGDLMYTWAEVSPDLSSSYKTVSHLQPAAGDVLTYTLHIANQGLLEASFLLTDAIPTYTSYVPDSVWASGGTITDTAPIRWSGTVDGSTTLSATFAVTVEIGLAEPTAILNLATLAGDPAGPMQLRAVSFVNPWQVSLPLVLRN